MPAGFFFARASADICQFGRVRALLPPFHHVTLGLTLSRRTPRDALVPAPEKRADPDNSSLI
jgi:hypothetical protein